MITASAGYGGGPQHVYDLALSLGKKALVNIACPKQFPFFDRFKEAIEGDIIEIPERRFMLKYAWRLTVFTRKNGIEIIHSHGKGASLYGRFVSAITGIPLIHTPHGIHIDQYGYLMRAIYLGYEYCTGWIDRKKIFVSYSEFSHALKLRIARSLNSVVIFNGVSSSGTIEWKTSTRARIRSELGVNNHEVIIATLSRFDYAKNMHEMVKIAKLSSNLKFWFLGDGEDFNHIRSSILINHLDHVWLPGFVNMPLEYLAAADIYLSTSRWEGLPLAVLQAMSLSKPVVASEVNGNKDVVHHGLTGYLYPLGEPQIASDYIHHLAKDKYLRESIGERGLSLQKSVFNIDQMSKLTFDVYKDSLSK